MSGGGTDTVRSSVTLTLGATLENLVLTGAAAINGIGNGVANVLTGNAATNVLSGGGGADVLNGGGADVLIGGVGNDTFVTDGGDTITEGVSAGIDTVKPSVTLTLGANIEKLILTGSAAINCTGNTLANTLTGNTAANVMNGGGGTDTLIGGAGNDTYVTDGGDTIIEDFGQGRDTVQSSASLTLGDDVENLILTGSGATDGTGNALGNTLTGNAAANMLRGGGGADTLTGGRGADSFVFRTLDTRDSADRITDFSVADDTIRLQRFAFNDFGLGLGVLPASAFVRSLDGLALDTTDRIIYETDTGKIYFDRDGTGFFGPELLATLAPNLALTAADFFVF